jgi:endonuclease/exonuclease/phosphatase (EEP) superfamily protein YafD
MSRPLVALLLAYGALPWTWFWWRNHLGTFGDLLSLGLPLLAPVAILLVALAGVWLRWPLVLALVTSWTLALGLATFGPRLPARMDPPQDPIAFGVANVRFDNPTMAEGVRGLIARDFDVLVVPESTDEARDLLSAEYPYEQWIANAKRPYGVAVFSRYPLGEVDIDDDTGNGILQVTVDAPHPFVLLAVHLHRPAMDPQPGYVSHGAHYDEVVVLRERARAAEAATGLPAVIAGDLNLSDRVRGYRLLDGSFADVARDGWAGSTYFGGVYRYFLLRIDHVFASDGWCGAEADEFVVTGSDHKGVRLDLGPCP